MYNHVIFSLYVGRGKSTLLGSGTVKGKRLFLRIIENIEIDAYFRLG